jgi:hypothetical protein
MKKINTYQMRFHYHNQAYDARILKIVYDSGEKVFQVDFKAAQYWLIYSALGWKILGDIKLCNGLNEALINAVADYTPDKEIVMPLTRTDEPLTLLEKII